MVVPMRSYALEPDLLHVVQRVDAPGCQVLYAAVPLLPQPKGLLSSYPVDEGEVIPESSSNPQQRPTTESLMHVKGTTV